MKDTWDIFTLILTTAYESTIKHKISLVVVCCVCVFFQSQWHGRVELSVRFTVISKQLR